MEWFIYDIGLHRERVKDYDYDDDYDNWQRCIKYRNFT